LTFLDKAIRIDMNPQDGFSVAKHELKTILSGLIGSLFFKIMSFSLNDIKS